MNLIFLLKTKIMKTQTKIRFTLIIFIVLLLLSGITAFPLRTEMDFLMLHKSSFPLFMQSWIEEVYSAIAQTPDLVLYGTDWLAFAHIIIALFFIPVYVDPVKHKANLVIGMISCATILPLAFICGPIRGIPFFHQLIDCSFGVIGIAFLFFILTHINKLNPSHHEITR
jgi:hypothetical protein